MTNTQKIFLFALLVGFWSCENGPDTGSIPRDRTTKDGGPRPSWLPDGGERPGKTNDPLVNLTQEERVQYQCLEEALGWESDLPYTTEELLMDLEAGYENCNASLKVYKTYTSYKNKL